MSRIARIILEGVPYHITQRGNGRQQVFFEDRDYILYLDLLRNNCTEERLSIWAYCLMPNHIHLITMPERAAAMAQAMGRTNADFARYYNLRKRSRGHVWQARYHSTPLDASHLWRAMAYVERNPVRKFAEIRDSTLKHNFREKTSPLATQVVCHEFARIILEGVPYHITQRGNGRQQVFFEDRDYILYLDLLS